MLYYLPDDPATRAVVAGAVPDLLPGRWSTTSGASALPSSSWARSPARRSRSSAGLTIDHITLPFVGVADLGPAQYPLTVLWFVAIVNMINFSDGMDGLAAGITGIGATTFALLAASLGRADPAIMAAALAGACVAFLVFNFHPAKVFMGDAGSMFLGS